LAVVIKCDRTHHQDYSYCMCSLWQWLLWGFQWPLCNSLETSCLIVLYVSNISSIAADAVDHVVFLWIFVLFHSCKPRMFAPCWSLLGWHKRQPTIVIDHLHNFSLRTVIWPPKAMFTSTTTISSLLVRLSIQCHSSDPNFPVLPCPRHSFSISLSFSFTSPLGSSFRSCPSFVSFGRSPGDSRSRGLGPVGW